MSDGELFLSDGTTVQVSAKLAQWLANNLGSNSNSPLFLKVPSVRGIIHVINQNHIVQLHYANAEEARVLEDT
jgi:hypothetical protein